jgi:uncharacterized membrane protein YeaQ/YmgE (transglycosylase-associated protein family)
MTGWLTDWLAGWLSDWLAGWLMTDWLAGWLADWLTDWLAGWLADWLMTGYSLVQLMIALIIFIIRTCLVRNVWYLLTSILKFVLLFQFLSPKLFKVFWWKSTKHWRANLMLVHIGPIMKHHFQEDQVEILQFTQKLIIVLICCNMKNMFHVSMEPW